MVERRTVKLKLTQEQAAQYVPPPGINVHWLKWFPSRNEVVATFSASDVQIDPLLRKTVSDIRHELGTKFKGRVIDDNIPRYENEPLRIMRLEAMLDHPHLATAPREVKRAVDAATDVHDIELTPEQAEELPKGKHGTVPHPKEVRMKKTRTHAGETEKEVYVYSFGEIDSG